MTHSILIVGGTREKRTDVAATHAPARPAGGSPSHFDTTTLEPQENKQTITIEQIRTLQHQLSLKPYSANKKTGVILEAQRLTVEAQNALLKTLEEPPAQSLLILTAPSTKSLLATIVSRCQIMRLSPKIDLNTKSEEHKKAAGEFLELLQMGRGERLAWAEDNKKILNSQLSTLNLLDVWISVLRDLLLIQNDCADLALNNGNGSRSGFNDHKNWERFPISIGAIEKANKTKRLLSTTNVSPRLAIEVILLDLPTLERARP